jgi:hypothetical protein
MCSRARLGYGRCQADMAATAPWVVQVSRVHAAFLLWAVQKPKPVYVASDVPVAKTHAIQEGVSIIPLDLLVPS